MPIAQRAATDRRSTPEVEIRLALLTRVSDPPPTDHVRDRASRTDRPARSSSPGTCSTRAQVKVSGRGAHRQSGSRSRSRLVPSRQSSVPSNLVPITLEPSWSWPRSRPDRHERRSARWRSSHSVRQASRRPTRAAVPMLATSSASRSLRGDRHDEQRLTGPSTRSFGPRSALSAVCWQDVQVAHESVVSCHGSCWDTGPGTWRSSLPMQRSKD
jgi:hypothetical protein